MRWPPVFDTYRVIGSCESGTALQWTSDIDVILEWSLQKYQFNVLMGRQEGPGISDFIQTLAETAMETLLPLVRVGLEFQKSTCKVRDLDGRVHSECFNRDCAAVKTDGFGFCFRYKGIQFDMNIVLELPIEHLPMQIDRTEFLALTPSFQNQRSMDGLNSRWTVFVPQQSTQSEFLSSGTYALQTVCDY